MGTVEAAHVHDLQHTYINTYIHLAANSKTLTAMDAFEARLQFTSRLSRLGAGQQAARSCAQFALKHKEYHEDLHSCILEQLASVRSRYPRHTVLIYTHIPIEKKRNSVHWDCSTCPILSIPISIHICSYISNDPNACPMPRSL